jgi:hypothetical protein
MIDVQLNQEEARVLGALMEKQMTTPEYYPLSLNALTNACNQKNNRDPFTAYDETVVVRALDGLRDKRLAAMVSEAGSRVPKYKHQFSEVVGLDERDAAVMCELLLRGPQTPGELRSRAERMAAFENLEQVEAVLAGLMEQKKMVVKLPRQPGRKESRFAHVLCGTPEIDGAAVGDRSPNPEPVRLQMASDNERIAKLEAAVIALKAQFEQFKKQFE